MSERPPRVFLSVGTKQSKEQEQFIAALQLLLSNAGFEMRRAQWSAINPLAKIKEEMNGCDGAVMVAFERIYAKEGRERSSSTKFTRITDQRARSGKPPAALRPRASRVSARAIALIQRQEGSEVQRAFPPHPWESGLRPDSPGVAS